MTTFLEILGDTIYQVREWNKRRKFKRLIKKGVEKCEPRFRPIISLERQPIPGTVEYAHIERYYFASRNITGGRVLNAACGSGYGNAILAAAGCQPVGVDLYTEPLELARRHFPYGEYMQADVLLLDCFPSNSFDSIISFETIEHVRDPALACQEFIRILRPGGVFVGSIPIMVFHNPGSNFTWQAAKELVENTFPGSAWFIQTNSLIAPYSPAIWRTLRAEGDKYLLWVWHRND